MAHITRSVDVDAPVDTVQEEWQRFEDLPRCAAHTLTANVRWRAEVLTLQPTLAGTRITVKIEYEPSGADAGLSCRLEAVLQSFTRFFEARRGRPVLAQLA